MKYLLLLPDFYQSGEIKAWGEDMSLPVPVSICKDIPAESYGSFVLGIPESLLRANVEQDFVYTIRTLNSKKYSFFLNSWRGR